MLLKEVHKGGPEIEALRLVVDRVLVLHTGRLPNLRSTGSEVPRALEPATSPETAKVEDSWLCVASELL